MAAPEDVLTLQAGHQVFTPVRNQVTDDDTVDVLATEIEFVFEPGGGFGAVGEDILPAVDNAVSLGSAAKRWVRASVVSEVIVGDAAAENVVLTDTALEVRDDSLVQRIRVGIDQIWIANAAALKTHELAEGRLTLRDGDQATSYERDRITLQDDTGAVKFEVRLDTVLKLMAPLLPTSDPVVVGQVWNDTGTLKVSAG